MSGPILPRFQVFVSSTYEDLKDARLALAQRILQLGHIPAGMEDFNAQSDRGWGVITKTIDRSDYYLLVVAGRYGKLFEDSGKSWTEKEYDYARERGLEVFAFVRVDDAVTAKEMDDQQNLLWS